MKQESEYFEIHAPEKEYLYVQPSQITEAGKGLFSAIHIFKNEIIAVFRGKILSDGEIKQRTARNYTAYFMNLPDGKILDCMHTPGFAKYANDAEGISVSSFKNNSSIILYEEEICLIATKTIRPGQEIFCSYGKDYWKHFLKYTKTPE